MALLEVKDLEVTFYQKHTSKQVVKDLSFFIEQGEIVGIVGESGSGKTQTSLSILKLLKENATITKGSILLQGEEISSYSEKEMSKIRGKEISMIFQEPMTALNPVKRIGKQIEESMKLHLSLSKDERKKRVLEAMKMVELPDVEQLYRKYPHELSGGMRQRVMIASALCMNPKLLIADEPTTALDVTVQAQIIRLLKKLNEENKISILFISHDLGVIHQLCHRVLVMKDGRKVEEGSIEQIFQQPKEAYTKELLASIPNRKVSLRRERRERRL